MNDQPVPDNLDEGDRFRATLTRVLAVQVLTLVLLRLLQAAYHG